MTIDDDKHFDNRIVFKSIVYPIDPLAGPRLLAVDDLRVVAAPREHVFSGDGAVVPAHVHRHTGHVRMKDRGARGSELVDQLLHEAAEGGVEAGHHSLEEVALESTSSASQFVLSGGRKNSPIRIT
jgi:hypothetical protein